MCDSENSYRLIRAVAINYSYKYNKTENNVKIASKTVTKKGHNQTYSALLKGNSLNELPIEISMSNINHSSTMLSVIFFFKIVHLEAEILWSALRCLAFVIKFNS